MTTFLSRFAKNNHTNEIFRLVPRTPKAIFNSFTKTFENADNDVWALYEGLKCIKTLTNDELKKHWTIREIRS